MKQNCINCGAPLHYNNDDLICRCDYCGTEYHIKKESGICSISEYEFELEIAGKKRKFYAGDIKLNKLCFDSYRNARGELVKGKTIDKLKMTLIEM